MPATGHSSTNRAHTWKPAILWWTHVRSIRKRQWSVVRKQSGAMGRKVSLCMGSSQKNTNAVWNLRRFTSRRPPQRQEPDPYDFQYVELETFGDADCIYWFWSDPPKPILRNNRLSRTFVESSTDPLSQRRVLLCNFRRGYSAYGIQDVWNCLQTTVYWYRNYYNKQCQYRKSFLQTTTQPGQRNDPKFVW